MSETTMNGGSPSGVTPARVFTWLSGGALAGFTLGLVDCGEAALGGVLLAALPLVHAQTALGVSCGALIAGVLFVARRLSPAAPLKVVAALSTAGALALGFEVFSGPGISKTAFAPVGPWLLALFGGGVVLATEALMADGRRRRPLALVLLLLVVVVLLAERRLPSGLYFYLHVVAVLAATVALTMAAVALVRLSPSPVARKLMLLVVVTAPLSLLLSRDDDAQRDLVARARGPSARTVAALRLLFGAGGAERMLRRAADPECGSDESCSAAPLRLDDLVHPLIDRDVAARVRAAAAGRPTVVLLVDALRADRALDAKFPNLARLRSSAIGFPRTYAPASSTHRSLPAIVTGRSYPRRDEQTSISQLARGGVPTALVSIDAVVERMDEAAKPFLDGFANVIALPTTKDDRSAWGGGVRVRTAARVTDAAFGLLDDRAPPGLLWVHYFDLHQWEVLDGVEGEGAARYDAALAVIDDEIGRWWARASDINLILTSDHGESFGRDGVDKHTLYLYPELVRVPLWLRVPGVEPVSVVTSVALADLGPTLVDLLIEGAGPFVEQRSLLGLVGVPRAPSRPIPMFESRHMALLESDRRLLYDLQSGRSWLYDSDNDPDEQRDLSKREPLVVERMLARLGDLVDDTNRRGGGDRDGRRALTEARGGTRPSGAPRP